MTPNSVNRRDFLHQAGLAGAGLLTGAELAAGAAGDGAKGVALVADPEDKVASSAPARWALNHLRETLTARRGPHLPATERRRGGRGLRRCRGVRARLPRSTQHRPGRRQRAPDRRGTRP
jgi:hypothetical protein